MCRESTSDTLLFYGNQRAHLAKLSIADAWHDDQLLRTAEGPVVLSMLDNSRSQDLADAGKFFQLFRGGRIDIHSGADCAGVNWRGISWLLRVGADFARELCAGGKTNDRGEKDQESNGRRVPAKIVFHECKLLIKKRMRTRRSRVHSARSPGVSKSCRRRRRYFHKPFPQSLWKRKAHAAKAEKSDDFCARNETGAGTEIKVALLDSYRGFVPVRNHFVSAAEYRTRPRPIRLADESFALHYIEDSRGPTIADAQTPLQH